MEQAFFTKYYEGENAFYVSSKNSKGEEELVNKYMPSQNTLWTHKNTKFEKLLLEDQDLSQLCGKMFHIWDGNHHLQVWQPYIDLNHHDEEDWHISIDVFVLDTTNGLVEFLIAMIDLN